MSTSADGELAKALTNLETLLANSTTFQTAVGAADAAAAKAAIYWMGQEPSVTTVHAWIRLAPGATGSKQGSGGGGYWHKFPFILVLFRPDASDTIIASSDTAAQRNAKHKERVLAFLTYVGQVMREMELLAYSGSYLHVEGISVNAIALSATDETEADPYMMAELGVQV